MFSLCEIFGWIMQNRGGRLRQRRIRVCAGRKGWQGTIWLSCTQHPVYSMKPTSALQNSFTPPPHTTTSSTTRNHIQDHRGVSKLELPPPPLSHPPHLPPRFSHGTVAGTVRDPPRGNYPTLPPQWLWGGGVDLLCSVLHCVIWSMAWLYTTLRCSDDPSQACPCY